MGDPDVPVRELIQTSDNATSNPENNSSSVCQGSPKDEQVIVLRFGDWEAEYILVKSQKNSTSLVACNKPRLMMPFSTGSPGQPDPATIKPETQGARFISPQIDANDGADVGDTVQATHATVVSPGCTSCFTSASDVCKQDGKETSRTQLPLFPRGNKLQPNLAASQGSPEPARGGYLKQHSTRSLDAEPQTRCYARVPLSADFIAPRGRSLNSVGEDAYGGGSRPRTNKLCANGEAPSNIPRHSDGAHTAESEASARKVNKNTWRILPSHLKESKSAKTSVPGEIQTVSTTEMKARCFPWLR